MVVAGEFGAFPAFGQCGAAAGIGIARVVAWLVWWWGLRSEGGPSVDEG